MKKKTKQKNNSRKRHKGHGLGARPEKRPILAGRFSQNLRSTEQQISAMTSEKNNQKKLKPLPPLKKPFNLHFKLQKPKTIRSNKRTIRSIHIRIPHSKKKRNSKEMKELSSGQAKKMQKQGVSAITQALKDILVVEKEKSVKKNMDKNKKPKRKTYPHKKSKKTSRR